MNRPPPCHPHLECDAPSIACDACAIPVLGPPSHRRHPHLLQRDLRFEFGLQVLVVLQHQLNELIASAQSWYPENTD